MDESTLPLPQEDQEEAISTTPACSGKDPSNDDSTISDGWAKLPAEIRLQVWNYLLPAPRIVYLCWEDKSSRFCLSPPHPATFSVNWESRMESIAHLTSRDDLSLGVSTVALADSVPKPPRHFFSKLDTALVDKRSVGTLAFHFFVWYIEKFIGQDGLSQIRHFAVEDIVWTELQKNPKQGDCIAFLASLDTFTVFSRKFGETDTPGEELELLEPIELRVNHPNGHMESVRSVVLRILTEYTQSLPGHRIPEIRMRNAGRRAGDGPSVTELPAMESLRLGE